MYLDDCIHDADALRVWLEARPAYVVPYTLGLPDQQEIPHATSFTSESIHTQSGTISPDGAVSDALKATLQPNTHPAYRV